MAGFYLQAAGILDELAAQSNSLKALINAAPAPGGAGAGNVHKGGRGAQGHGGAAQGQAHKRRLLALCANTLAYQEVLDEIISHSRILSEKDARIALSKGGADVGPGTAKTPAAPEADGRPAKKQKVDKGKGKQIAKPSAKSLLLVLLYDMLFSPSALASGSAKVSSGGSASGAISTSASYAPTAYLLSRKASLRAALARVQLRHGAATAHELRSDHEARTRMDRIPRWVRLNTARFEDEKTAVEEWEEFLRDELHLKPAQRKDGWLRADPQASTENYASSSHVRQVYALPARLTSSLIGRSEWYGTGRIVLQDLASCFPAQILADWYAAHVLPTRITAAAASGQKTLRIHALDATSAPGNKTSHLSTLLHALATKAGASSRDVRVEPCVSALEKDGARFRTLVSLLGKVGALRSAKDAPPKPPLLRPLDGAYNVECYHADFLAIGEGVSTGADAEGKKQGHAKTAQVKRDEIEMMLVDPSCSGSGILSRLDHLSKDTEQEQEADDTGKGQSTAARLASLANFQLAMVKHAMTAFPALRCFTYSTCSVHAEENEHVVARALALADAKEHGWRLASREDVLPTWPQRGMPMAQPLGNAPALTAEQSDALVRAAPGGAPELQDAGENGAHVEATNGFFVCLFVRDERSGHGAATGKIQESKTKKKSNQKAEVSG